MVLAILLQRDPRPRPSHTFQTHHTLSMPITRSSDHAHHTPLSHAPFVSGRCPRLFPPSLSSYKTPPLSHAQVFLPPITLIALHALRSLSTLFLSSTCSPPPRLDLSSTFTAALFSSLRPFLVLCLHPPCPPVFATVVAGAVATPEACKPPVVAGAVATPEAGKCNDQDIVRHIQVRYR